MQHLDELSKGLSGVNKGTDYVGIDMDFSGMEANGSEDFLLIDQIMGIFCQT
jgi:hypothetical protein